MKIKDMSTVPVIYKNIIVEKFPANSELWSAFINYLNMRLERNPHLGPGEWEACLTELLDHYTIEGAPQAAIKSTAKHSRARRLAQNDLEAKPFISISDLIYLIQVATSRGRNHIYQTKAQDAEYPNISYYQNPYWTDLITNSETRALLEEELTRGR